jgi:hypothetical protein
MAAAVDNLDKMRGPYQDARASGQDHIAALAWAVKTGLRDDPETATEIVAFLIGDMDAQFGKGSGDALGNLLIDGLEKGYALEVFLAEAPSLPVPFPQPRNIAELAEDYATDTKWSYAYRRALDEYPEIGPFMRRTVVETIVEMASIARTTVGQKVKIEQAEKTIAMLGRKARRYPDDVRAVNQAIWCDALVAELKPLRK